MKNIKVFSLLERFEHDLEHGFDSAFDNLDINYQNELTYYEKEYTKFFYNVISLYYQAYRFTGNTHADSGITFLIREQQKDLLLNLLNEMKESEEK